MADKEHYCTVANDGVAVCVCKYRPCEKLKRKEQECKKLKQECKKLKQEYSSLLAEKNALEIGRDEYRQRYNYCKQAIDKIEELCKDHPFCDCSCGQDILDIINKAKEQ